MQSINLIVSAVIQVILLAIIPFVWWLVKGKRQSDFFDWLGIRKPIIRNKKKYIAIFMGTTILYSYLSFLIIPLLIEDSNMATSQFAGQGVSALIPVLIYAFLQTGFSEELFFRGFLTKRFVNKFGFVTGNIVQGLLFGLIHGLMFISLVGVLKAVIIILITSSIGLLMGWINERQSDGSIVSSWLIHGCVNTIASTIAMFNLI